MPLIFYISGDYPSNRSLIATPGAVNVVKLSETAGQNAICLLPNLDAYLKRNLQDPKKPGLFGKNNCISSDLSYLYLRFNWPADKITGKNKK